MRIKRLAFVLILLACPALVRGNEICYTPTLAVKEEYNTNIMLVPDSEMPAKDFITTISPGLDISDKTGRLDYLMSLRLDRFEYSRYKDVSATNQLYSVGAQYAATPRFKVTANASYQKNFNLSFDTGALPPPPPPSGGGGSSNDNPPGNSIGSSGTGTNPSTGTLQQIAYPLNALSVENITSSASMDYQMTELTSFSALYQYSTDSYQSPHYHDESSAAQAGLVIDLGKYLSRVKGRVNTGYSQYRLPASTAVNVTGSIGFTYDISKTWSILADGGLRRTTSESVISQTSDTSGGGRQDSTDWGRVAALSLNYNGEYTGLQLQYAKAFSLTSGLQAATEQDSLSLTARYQVNYELSAFLTAGYNTYRSEPSQNALVVRETSIGLTPLVRYELSKDMALEASYDRVTINYESTHTRANREIYFIRLSTRFPYCSSSQYK